MALPPSQSSGAFAVASDPTHTLKALLQVMKSPPAPGQSCASSRRAAAETGIQWPSEPDEEAQRGAHLLSIINNEKKSKAKGKILDPDAKPFCPQSHSPVYKSTLGHDDKIAYKRNTLLQSAHRAQLPKEAEIKLETFPQLKKGLSRPSARSMATATAFPSHEHRMASNERVFNNAPLLYSLNAYKFDPKSKGWMLRSRPENR